MWLSTYYYEDNRAKSGNGIKDRWDKALDWPDPVNAELLRGGMEGGHMLSHPVILEHMKQGGFACIVQPWNEYLWSTIVAEKSSEPHLERVVCQTFSRVRGSPERPWTSPRETSCQFLVRSRPVPISDYLEMERIWDQKSTLVDKVVQVGYKVTNYEYHRKLWLTSNSIWQKFRLDWNSFFGQYFKYVHNIIYCSLYHSACSLFRERVFHCLLCLLSFFGSGKVQQEYFYNC